MRPRVFPAEDPSILPQQFRAKLRFNEAAGIPRGRLRLSLSEAWSGIASMRPRVFPAEDAL